MQEAEDANRVRHYGISSDIGRARDDELARAGDPAGSPALRKFDETVGREDNLLVDVNGGSGIFGFDVREDVVAIGERDNSSISHWDKQAMFCGRG